MKSGETHLKLGNSHAFRNRSDWNIFNSDFEVLICPNGNVVQKNASKPRKMTF
jgi:hypothetical protein